MPEGPSIVILKEQAAKFAGKRVRAVSGNSRQPISRMQGLVVRDVCSWGKHFLLPFDGFALRVHFLLFGSSRVDDPKADASPRLTLEFDNGRLDLYACSVRFLEGDLDSGCCNLWSPLRGIRNPINRGQVKCTQYGCVGRKQRFYRDITRKLPRQLLVFIRMRLAMPLQHTIKVKPYGCMRVGKCANYPGVRMFDMYAQFFQQFALECVQQWLAWSDLATRKLPVAGIGFAFWPAG